MKKNTKKLGELLQEAGLIDDLQLKSALAYQGEWGGRLGAILIKKGLVSEEDMLRVIEQQFGLPSISLRKIERPPEEVMKLVRVDVARKFGAFPLRIEGGRNLIVAVADPTDLKTLDDLQFTIGVRVKPVLALESEIARAIDIHYEGKVWEEKEKIAMRVSRTISPAAAPTPEEMVIERPVDRDREQEPQPAPARKARVAADITQKAVVEGIIDLLVAKGIITREELIRQILSKKD